MSAATFLPPAIDAGQSGPIRHYPENPGGSVPAGVAALGNPEFVHRYQSFAEQCHLGWLFGGGAGKHPTYFSYSRALVVVSPQGGTCGCRFAARRAGHGQGHHERDHPAARFSRDRALYGMVPPSRA